jgi:hypothetical protein
MRRLLLAAAVLLLALPAAADARVRVDVTATEVVLGNGQFERRWQRAGLTSVLVDKRGGTRTAPRRDFALDLAGRVAEVGSERFAVTAVRTTALPREGVRVTMDLRGPVPGLTATRIAEAWTGVAGVRTQTIVHATAGLTLAGATLDEAAPPAAAPTLHAFRAGADWREPEWEGPPLTIGDPHAGTWRDTRTAGEGEGLAGPGQWLSLRRGARSLFLVMEANDLPSSRAEYAGGVAALRSDWSRDVLSLGPLEESGHFENPGDGPGRVRVVEPGEDLALAPVFTGFAVSPDDEAWQFRKYLDRRVPPWPRDVIFNSDGTDQNRISTGAKDDMDIATVREVAPLARRLGADLFVLDDGWQAISGDWEPDSPQHPEPRGTPPRFPDPEFRAVREAIAPMRLGLWMSPMHFHPASRAYREHPEWACTPVGHATGGASILQPDEGSYEAGIGAWGPAAIPHVQSRIEHAITAWDVRFFKFDFLAWLDCAGQGELWDMHDRFVAMLDALQAKHPHVVFQIDETNDYRLFPFESVSRGPTWFQNGAPDPDRLLHNLWNLSPYVPAHALGQKALAGEPWKRWPVDTVMATALLSEIMFVSDLRTMPEDVIAAARPWVDFAKAHRADLDGVVFPLLDDPLARGWTALQSWDPERGRGALLAFRQDAAEPTRTIALRAVPPGRTFTLRAAPGGEVVGTATSAQLRAGLPVTIDQPRGARVLLVEPAA